jgi:hypothetical protein
VRTGSLSEPSSAARLQCFQAQPAGNLALVRLVVYGSKWGHEGRSKQVRVYSMLFTIQELGNIGVAQTVNLLTLFHIMSGYHIYVSL